MLQNGIKMLRKLTTVFGKNSPTIYAIVAGGGVIVTAILAGKAAIEANEILKEEKIEREKESGKFAKPLAVGQTITLTWECYIPTLLVGAATISCIVLSNSINAKRNAALATMYTITDTAFKEYKNKVVSTIGSRKETEIRDDISIDRATAAPPNAQVFITEKGNTLCFDEISGRFFKGDIEKIRQARNEINKNLRNDMFIPLNDFYYEINLDGIKIGEDVGWHIDKGYLDISITAMITPNGEPCLNLNYDVTPKFA